MSDNDMIYCLIAFILGWLISRHMGNGFSVGGDTGPCVLNEDYNCADYLRTFKKKVILLANKAELKQSKN